MSLRAGDTVLHRPTGETWVLGAVVGGDVLPLGWPCSYARASDVELVEAATDAEHHGLLQRLSNMQGTDPRKTAALDVLARANPAAWLLRESARRGVTPGGHPVTLYVAEVLGELAGRIERGDLLPPEWGASAGTFGISSTTPAGNIPAEGTALVTHPDPRIGMVFMRGAGEAMDGVTVGVAPRQCLKHQPGGSCPACGGRWP